MEEEKEEEEEEEVYERWKSVLCVKRDVELFRLFSGTCSVRKFRSTENTSVIIKSLISYLDMK